MTEEQKYLEASLKDKKIGFIKEIVSGYYKQPITDYEIRVRRREIIKLKYVTIYLILSRIKVNLTELGLIFKYNHATVIHANKQIIGYLTFDKELKAEIDEMQSLIDHKMTIIDGRLNLDDDYAYINLNECVGVNLTKGRGIVFSGISPEDIEKIMSVLSVSEENRKITSFSNTGMYLLKKIDTDAKETNN